MRQLSGRVLGCLLLSGLLGACSGGAARSPDGGADLGISSETCQGIRTCLWGCTTDMAACVQTCIDKGSPQAQMVFQALAACTAPFCQSGDFTCGCQEQCYGEGHCLTETEACAAGTSIDSVCDNLCH